MTHINLFSNLKFVTSGAAPTPAVLFPGQAAFGRWTAANGGDDAYHLWANISPGAGPGAGTVVDITASTMQAMAGDFDLQGVLERGNSSELSILLTGIQSVFRAELAGGNAELAGGGLTVEHGDVTAQYTGTQMRIVDGDTSVTNINNIMASLTRGFVDHNNTVLSGNTARTYAPIEIETMRNKLNVYSRDEIGSMVSQVFDFKGVVDQFVNLPNDPTSGDVWLIGDTGLLYVWVDGGPGGGGWERLNYLFSLTDYWTSTQVQAAIAALRTEIIDEIQRLELLIDDVEVELTGLDTRVTGLRTDLDAHVQDAVAGTDSMHSNNNFTDTAVIQVSQLMLPSTDVTLPGLQNGVGDGSTILTCSGRYATISVAVEQI